jgi:hypothetical protein
LCFEINLWRGTVTAGKGWWRPMGGLWAVGAEITAKAG